MGRTRTFIAAPLDEAIRTRLGTLCRACAKSASGVRWTPLGNLHITLNFLGDVEDSDLPSVCRAAQQAVDDVELRQFPLSIVGLGCFPKPARPRILWAGVAEGHEQLELLHAALEERFADLGFRPEGRAYSPHVTLGRVKPDGPRQNWEAILAAHQEWEAGSQIVAEVHVMGSELTPEGSAYSVLSRVKLPKAKASESA